MGRSVAKKLIETHVDGDLPAPGEEVALQIDNVLLQDATGTIAWQAFEMFDVPRVRVNSCVQYVDHNTLQASSRNAEDHIYLQDVCAKYGAIYSRPGNGISHFCHMERFDRPGETLLGADSHTTQAGALGMLAIGAGGLEVAQAMAGGPFHVQMPQVVRVWLEGELPPWVSAKDVILHLLQKLTVRGGRGKIIEFAGPGLATLGVPERGTIANMTAELGATAPVFPSDEQTKRWLKAQSREADWIALEADPDAEYDDEVTVNLSELEPLIAMPHSPDNVVPVAELVGTPLAQVAIGSSVNSSYMDLMTAADILDGNRVSERLQSVVVSPGSRQILLQVLQDGGLAKLLKAGVRELETACGPCIGMGQAPPAFGNSLRTFNRNFAGRSGTADDRVFLSSPEVAAVSAIKGEITDPRRLGRRPRVVSPASYVIDDSLFIRPPKNGAKVEIRRGPNIIAPPVPEPPRQPITATVTMKAGDNISTDDILPAGAEVLPLRSDIPDISEFTFRHLDPGFPQRCREAGDCLIVGGHNYGQGSSREHAAIAPMYLGVKAVLAKSFARIHQANLAAWGVVPLVFDNEADYDAIELGDIVEVENLLDGVCEDFPVVIALRRSERTITVRVVATARQRKVLGSGGFIPFQMETGALG